MRVAHGGPSRSNRSTARRRLVRTSALLSVATTIVATLVGSSGAARAAAPSPASPVRDTGAPVVLPTRHVRPPRDRGSDQLVVTLDQTVGTNSAPALRAAQAAGLKARGARPHNGGRSFIVRLPAPLKGAQLQDAIDALAAEPGVASVEPDRRLYPTYTPNDPFFNDQWNMRGYASKSAGSNAAAAWDINVATTDVVVAVVDTGYVDHPDLAGRLLPGYDFIANSKTANDGDGRDADAHDPGDWVTASEVVGDPFFSDCSSSSSTWHGSHVTGIIGAAGNNAVGVAGITWTNKILPVRALGKCGGDSSDVEDAIRWAAGLAVSGVPENANPAKVINLSLGGYAKTCSAGMQSAINDVLAAGAVVVTAAGNEHTSASNNEPGNCIGVINVAATGKNGARASYSNYGSAVTLAAPGGGDGSGDYGIRSTVDLGNQEPDSPSYAYESGTSMAAPHVAGAAALVMSIASTLTPAQVRSVLTSTARPFPGTSTCAGQCGAGYLDVQAAVVAAGNLRVPTAPTDLIASPGPRTVSLSWAAPADTGGTDIVDYRIQRSSNGGKTWTTVSHVASTGTGLAISGLTNGRAYLFRVAAINHVGTGAWSETASATPATVPSTPRSLRATRGAGQVRLTWMRPRSNGGATIDDYTIEQSTNGLFWTEVVDGASPAASYTVTGLTNGTKYYFRVAAKNWAGQGGWSARTSMTPLARPSAPFGLVAFPDNKLVSLVWSHSTDVGGTPITKYVVQRSSNGGITWTTVRGTTANSLFTVRSLRNGTAYLFRVAARNKVGQSPWSEPFAATPRTKASAPQNLIATAGDQHVVLSWLAPKSNGGNAVALYQVERSTDGITWDVIADTVDATLLTYDATALTNGITYRFRVAAINAAGVGAYSSVRTATPVAPVP